MKLYTSLTSPYGRKCRMAAHVAGVAAGLEVVDIDYKADAYKKINPLGKVPALERNDGTILIESSLICAYLGSKGDEKKLMGLAGEPRWQAQCLEALADGIMDAGVLIFMERKRDPDKQSPDWLERQENKISAGLDAIEAVAGEFGVAKHVGILAVAACVNWLIFRNIVDGVLDNRPNLRAWLQDFNTFECAIATLPPVDA